MAIPEPSLIIGIDTGGTTTDAVILRAESGEILSVAKCQTTKNDLAIGVTAALEAVVSHVDPDDVALVSVSTTLATNAVVEGHGSPILVFLVGFDEAMVERTGITGAFGDVTVVLVDGGHDHYGTEQAALDIDAVMEALGGHAGKVDAVAVASTFAVRNPAHEQQIRDIVLEHSDLPVTVSSSLSDALDAPRRALTTVLNARLLSRIAELIDAVRGSVVALGIDAEVLMAKGDGSLAIADAVAQRPIETILSGPAASIIGASKLTGLSDFVVSDIGGTTTDVARIRDGRPKLLPTGARVGDWQTMVEAVDVQTTGLGGDSAVRIEGMSIGLGPDRRVPVSVAAATAPELATSLRAQLTKPPSRDLAAVFVRKLEPVTIGRARAQERLSTLAGRTLAQLGNEAIDLLSLGAGALQRRVLQELAEARLVEIIGFTPTDAALVASALSGSEPKSAGSEVAELAAELLGWFTGETAVDFCARVVGEVARLSAGCVLDVALEGSLLGPALKNEVLNAVAAGEARLGNVRIAVELGVPVVAVGGPAHLVYPEATRRISAQLELPENFAVANAVGAASAFVAARVQSEVELIGPGSFRVVGGQRSTRVDDPEHAIAAAISVARETAEASLNEQLSGLDAGPIIEHVEVIRHDDPHDPEKGLYGAQIVVEVRRRPLG